MVDGYIRNDEFKAIEQFIKDIDSSAFLQWHNNSTEHNNIFHLGCNYWNGVPTNSMRNIGSRLQIAMYLRDFEE